jgi:uncharacterized membrane protein YraQ (UPF0718 family)
MDKSNSKTKQKQNGGIKFFLVVLFIYFIIALFNTHLIVKAVIDFLNMFIKIIPIICIVFIVMVGIDLYFTNERTKKYFGEKSGVKGWIYAIVSGSLISAPPYVLYPLLGQLKKQGMKNSLLAVFLYNRNVKIPFVPVMIYYFGLKFTVIISLYILIFSIVNGMLIGALVEKKKI